MAGGKLSPRQKMINMMYLVLTAMLALNISKDILEALTKLNDSLDQTVQTVDQKNADIYRAFDNAVADNPEKAKPFRDKAYSVKQESDELYAYINNLKEELIKVSGGKDENDLPKKLDAREAPANYLLNDKNATKLKERIEAYEASVLKYAEGDEQIQNNIKTLFDTEKKKVGDKMVDWESASFEHFPLAAILPFLTDIQARVRNTESDVISLLRSKIDAGTVKFTGVRAMVMPKSTYVTQGDEYQADVFLAAYDDTQEPEIIIGGEPLPEDQIIGGVGKIRFKANSVGEQKWAGVIKIKQIGKGEVEYPVEASYTVAPPSVVISPTKMNVLYRGVENPIEIGVPGVDPAKLRVSGPGISGSNGNYMAVVTNVKQKEVSISVSVEETSEDGKTEVINMGSKKFRIKGLPQAVGSIFGKTEGIMSKSLLKKAEVKAAYQDFPFDLSLSVSSFQIAIPGFPPEDVRGSRIPENVKQRIDRLKPGATVSIRKIKAKGPKGLNVPNISNISIDVN